MKSYLKNGATAVLLVSAIALSGVAFGQNHDEDRDSRGDLGSRYDRDGSDRDTPRYNPRVNRDRTSDMEWRHDGRAWQSDEDRQTDRHRGVDQRDYNPYRSEYRIDAESSPQPVRVHKNVRAYEGWSDDDYRYYLDQLNRYDRERPRAEKRDFREGYNKPSLRTSAGYDKNPDGDFEPDRSDEQRSDRKHNRYDVYDRAGRGEDDEEERTSIDKDLHNPRHRGGTAQTGRDR